MRSLILIPLLVLAPTAWAHEAVVEHSHPHGDWTLAGFGMLAVGLAAAALLPAATQTLGETQVGEGGVSLLHRGGDVGARGRGAHGAVVCRGGGRNRRLSGAV